MGDFEKPMTIRAISRRTGRTISEEYLRAACHRAASNHRLPHVECGFKRPAIKIRWSDFVAWYDEETKEPLSV